MAKLTVVVGGQYGSESKGAVTGWISRQNHRRDQPTIICRVAGPNAGHTVYDNEGVKYALRQIPAGVITNPAAFATIAAGSEIDPKVLIDEIHLLEDNGIPILSRLIVDQSATMIEPHHRDTENDAELVGRVGSTGKGIGAARADRIMRTAWTMISHNNGMWDPSDQITHERWRAWATEHQIGLRGLRTWGTINFGNTAAYTQEMVRDTGCDVVIEGTQGYGLGLHTEHYPQTTSSDCRAIDFMAMAGVAPWHGFDQFEIDVVMRAYPIRVAGNSGMLEQETTWDELGLPEERTTVTQKVRRVGQWDPMLAFEAVQANGGGYEGSPVRVAFAMADQEIPEIAGLHGGFSGDDTVILEDSIERILEDPDDDRTDKDIRRGIRTLEAKLEQIANETGAPVVYIGTGPQTQLWA